MTNGCRYYEKVVAVLQKQVARFQRDKYYLKIKRGVLKLLTVGKSDAGYRQTTGRYENRKTDGAAE